MLRWFIRRRIAAFERELGYDMSYARELLDADLRAFFLFARVSGLSEYRKGAPLDATVAAKLVGTVVEDCGPCTQLVVGVAEKQGVSAATLRAVLAGDVAAMSPEVSLAYRFARASLAHAAEADELREEILRRWGKRGLVSLTFALTAARMFPTLKYALGHGRACTRVLVAGTAAPVARALAAQAA